MSARLDGILAKIERAKEHVRDLDCRIAAFRKTEPYRIVADQEAKPPNRVYRVQVRSQPPPVISIVAGEAIQHLRGVLDHLAWQLVKANGGAPSRDTSFPIFEVPGKYKAKSPRKVQGMSAAAVSNVESVQPYQSGYDALWELQELNNIDKHRLLLVAGFGLHRFRFSATYNHPIMEGPQVKQFIAEFFAAVPAEGASRPPSFVMLQDGAEIGMNWLDGPLQHDEQFELTYEIAFGEPKIVEGKPILPFLHQATQLVEQIVGLFAPLL